MKSPASRVVLAVVMVIFVAMVVACNRSAKVQASFSVEGMHCESCSSAITDALEKLDGVESASADHETGSAEASYQSSSVALERLAAEIEGLGYTVTAVETKPIEG